MPDKYSRIATDNYRMARSGTLYELADGTYSLIHIPKYSFVVGVWLEVTQAYAGGASGAATIGWLGGGGDDADGFMDATACGARATGMKSSYIDTQPGSKGYWFDSASAVLTITLSAGTDTTMMIGTVFMMYSVLH